ncbi:GNAT family N-acetyltransferase [Micromonospora sp. NPDC023956]|uniref:GNAT family N-acetyltransferase n=1 Tax=Micromonospora sp. NPDC023956 TaxID=3155722 RepID=UPI0033E3BF30
MELVRIDPQTAGAVAGWASSVEETRRWCSRDEVTPETVAGWAADPEVEAYGLVEAGELVGYGELWPEDDEVELARLIVAPAHRGRGVGRRLVAALTGEAVRRQPAVFMRVHPANTPALRCYAAAGFREVPPEQADEWNRGQPVAYTWLRHGPAA